MEFQQSENILFELVNVRRPIHEFGHIRFMFVVKELVDGFPGGNIFMQRLVFVQVIVNFLLVIVNFFTISIGAVFGNDSQIVFSFLLVLGKDVIIIM